MSSANRINVFPEIKDACLGCSSEMPYRTVDETAAGVTIQIHLRYCDPCHKKTLADLRLEREIRASFQMVKAQAKVFDFIFGAVCRPQGGRS